MKVDEWVEAFVEINGRKPSAEEFSTAKKNGEFVTRSDIDNQNTTVIQDNSEPVLESIDAADGDFPSSHKKQASGQSVFCQSCGEKNLSDDQVCKKCGNVLKRLNTMNSSDYTKGNKLLSYLKFCLDNGKWGLLLYFGIIIGFELCIGIWPGILGILFSMYMLSESGQTLVCKLVGARPIERQDHRERIVRPVQQIIAKARTQGLNLPENIEVYIIQNEVPTAYAVGMNRIIVSESLIENPMFLESKIMFELNRIHNMTPNLLLVVIGANMFLVILGLFVMLFSSFYKNYGDRRKSFWSVTSEAKGGALIYYAALATLVGLLGFTFLFVRTVVRKDVALSDKFVASQGLGVAHCAYLDTVSIYDDSRTKKIFELGFPNKDKRIGVMQNNYGVKYR